MRRRPLEVSSEDTALDRLRAKKASLPRPQDDVHREVPFNTRLVVIFVAVVIIILGLLIFIGSAIKDPKTLSIDDLHEKNIAGKGDENSYMYNGFSFVRVEGLWYTQVSEQGGRLFDVALHYGPREVDNITISGNLNDSFFLDTDLYVTFDPKESNQSYVSLTAAELSLSLSKALRRIPTAACTKNETEVCSARPIISCENTHHAVLYIQEEGSPEVVFDGNCIRVRGVGWDLVRSGNRLLYQWYGIMKER